MPPRSRGVYSQSNLSGRRKRMYAFMQEHPIGVISTTNPDGNPHGTVIYFVVDHNLSLRFLTKKRTRKYDNLMHNNHLMLTVFEPHTQSILQYEGVAVEHEGQAATNQVARALYDVPLASNSGLPPLAKLQAGAFTTFQVEPVQIRMAVYGRPDVGDFNELFESVESFELVDT